MRANQPMRRRLTPPPLPRSKRLNCETTQMRAARWPAMDATHSKRSRATQLDGAPERPKKRRVDWADVAITLTFVASAGLAAWGWGQEPPRRHSAVEVDRGRMAAKPSAIPLAGWKDILVRSYREIADDDVASIGRSIAFSGILALFPALAAFVSIYGLFADVADAQRHLAALAGIIPADAMTLLGEQMVRLAAANQASLSLTFALGFLLSIWSANSGMKALFKGLNIAYEEVETRTFVRLNLTTLTFTLGTIALFILAVAAVIGVPVALSIMRIDATGLSLSWLRWPALLFGVAGAISLLYRFGPSREPAKWRWVTPGSLGAALLWIAGSSAFSWYLSNVADYATSYGSLGAIFGFMMWLWLSAVIVLFGAELNSEIERQLVVDSTTGAARPLGLRGARVADTVASAQRGSILSAVLAKAPASRSEIQKG